MYKMFLNGMPKHYIQVLIICFQMIIIFLRNFKIDGKFGVTEDGDITNIENLKSYKNICKKN